MDRDAMARQLAGDGYVFWPGLLDAGAAQALHAAILATRPFDERLFLTEAEWEAGPKSHTRTNPGPGYNLLERLTRELGFLHGNPELDARLAALLGEGYRWWQEKLVCRLPASCLPGWLHAKIRHAPANSLGAFVRPQWRDIGYFYDADLHQDIADYPRWPQPEHRLLTLYVYLGEVGPQDAPLWLLPGTHLLGATDFQHDVAQEGEEWVYRDGRGNRLRSRLLPFTGKAGDVGIWHPCLLHGSRYVQRDVPRISLRCMMARGQGSAPCILDEVNAQVAGPLFPVRDSTAGHTARADGLWTLRHNDFTRRAA